MDYKKWMLDERGIDASTLEHWNVTSDESSIRFPYSNGSIKVRTTKDDGTRSFRCEGPITLYHLPEPLKDTVFIVEGETDTLKLWQEIAKQKLTWKISVVGLSGLQGWKDEYVPLFKDVKHVRVVLDNDEAYGVAKTADLTYRKIRDSLGVARTKRVRLREAKDICEFFKKYSWDSFALITEALDLKHKRLDLTKDPTPYEWLVDNMICQSDVTLLVGEPNVGKSFISMALAIAVAEGKDTFLDEKLYAHGKVLYVDEENPEDVIYHRLSCLGLTSIGMDNLHYYHRQHIRLDRGIDDLLDDALTIKPKLIVIDSLTRVHNQDENNAGAMNTVFNEGIMPLARETGAAVLVLHHTNKSESSSSYTRTRGSSDIGAAIDTGIDIRSVVENTIAGEVNALQLNLYKSRRRTKGSHMRIHIADTLTGDIELRRLDKGGKF